MPDHFPSIDYTSDNSFTQERWELGKKLFYDPIMSRDSTISCSSCHLQEFAFSDSQDKSRGIEGRIGRRNVTPLFNLSYHPYKEFLKN